MSYICRFNRLELTAKSRRGKFNGDLNEVKSAGIYAVLARFTATTQGVQPVSHISPFSHVRFSLSWPMDNSDS